MVGAETPKLVMNSIGRSRALCKNSFLDSASRDESEGAGGSLTSPVDVTRLLGLMVKLGSACIFLRERKKFYIIQLQLV